MRKGTTHSQMTDELEAAVDAPVSAGDATELEMVEEEQQAALGDDERVSELQRELTLERDKYLRLAAEFDNFRKRMTKERVEAEGRGQAELVKQILDPLDDIARFADLDPAATDSATIIQGVDMVEKKLDKQLRVVGLETVNPVDAQFDPALHEAVATQPADTPEQDGTVAQVYQIGYTFKGQLLRPARVVVRQYHGSH
ncbi:MAG TPA: nucleotide exchange factor GrpE [Gemmatimonadaceae bacterium]|nr:nucleotide exchange factor GrpE [Gemmatimonadaceae bacterium]